MLFHGQAYLMYCFSIQMLLHNLYFSTALMLCFLQFGVDVMITVLPSCNYYLFPLLPLVAKWDLLWIVKGVVYITVLVILCAHIQPSTLTSVFQHFSCVQLWVLVSMATIQTFIPQIWNKETWNRYTCFLLTKTFLGKTEFCHKSTTLSREISYTFTSVSTTKYTCDCYSV